MEVKHIFVEALDQVPDVAQTLSRPTRIRWSEQQRIPKAVLWLLQHPELLRFILTRLDQHTQTNESVPRP